MSPCSLSFATLQYISSYNLDMFGNGPKNNVDAKGGRISRKSVEHEKPRWSPYYSHALF